MPIFDFRGVPLDTSQVKLFSLVKSCQQAVAGIKELGLKPEQISAFFPPELLTEGLGEEIIVFVRGLHRRPERTPAVIARLMAAVGEETKKTFPKALSVEVFVESVDPADCWMWQAD